MSASFTSVGRFLISRLALFFLSKKIHQLLLRDFHKKGCNPAGFCTSVVRSAKENKKALRSPAAALPLPFFPCLSRIAALRHYAIHRDRTTALFLELRRRKRTRESSIFLPNIVCRFPLLLLFAAAAYVFFARCVAIFFIFWPLCRDRVHRHGRKGGP